MLRVALKMLAGDRAKFTGLLFGIAFTSFLVTFAASFFTGFMTRGFSLVAENPGADVWVMDPAVNSAEQTTNMSDTAIDRVRSVTGVRSATPLALGTADVQFPNGRIQPFQIIGVDDATLAGSPRLAGEGSAAAYRAPDAAFVSAGGSTGKLGTPLARADRWPADGPHLDAPLRPLAAGDELEVNGQRVVIQGYVAALPRFPPRPLLYMAYSNAARVLLPERRRTTFVLVAVSGGVPAGEVARRIEDQTGLRARTAQEFKADTVGWYLENSEDVGDVTAMLLMAMTVGFGVTGVMLYMFTNENLRQYAVLKAMGATPRLLLAMVFTQAGLSAVLASGLGLGLCAIAGEIAASFFGFPFRLMWFAPLFGLSMVVLISVVAALLSALPILKLDPSTVFAGR